MSGRRPAGAAAIGRGRRVAVRLLAVLGLAALGFLLVFVLSDAAGRVGTAPPLVPGSSPAARLGAAHPGEAVHLGAAVGGLALLTAALGGLALRPDDRGSAAAAAGCVLAWLTAAVLVGDPDNVGGQAGVVDLAFVVLALPALGAVLLAAPGRHLPGEVRGPEGPVRARLLGAAVLGAPGWVAYGAREALLQRSSWPPLADPHHQAHWFAAALLAFLVLGAVGASALTGARRPAAVAGAVAVAVSVTSLATPSAASALGTVGAVAAGCWGAAVLLALRQRPIGARGRGPALVQPHG